MDAASTRNVWQRMAPAPTDAVLHSRTAAPGTPAYSSYTIRAKKYKPSQSLDGETPVRSRKWQLWRQLLDDATAVSPATLPCPAPKINDRITDSDTSEVWVIKSIEELLFGNCWNCQCVQEVP